MHPRHTRLASGLAGLALVLGTSAGSIPTAQAAEGDSPLRLMSQPKVTAYTYKNWVFSDLGLKLVATDEAFEVRSHRPADYDGPITSTFQVGDDAPVALPDGTMTSFSGLPDFLEVTLSRVSDGQQVRNLNVASCFNAYTSQRVSPAAPARSPYPVSCPQNPYTVGSVMGIQAGHAVSAMPEWGMSVRLKPGRYDLVATISPTYAELFGISAEDATVSSRLRVREEEEFEGMRRTQRPAPAAKPAAQEPRGAAPALAPGNPLPDLRSLPAWGIELNRKGTALRFAANVWNAGDSPLVIDGFRANGEDHMDSYQYFFDADGNQTSYTPEPVGQMHWHAENHNHWHFEDFATYNLLDADEGMVVKSTKQSFCLANTDAVDYTVEGADWRPENTDLSTACDGRDALSLRQVLSAGSGDTYYQYRYGQAFPIKDVPNGDYYIEVLANPLGNLVESDSDNNSSLRKVTLKGKPDNRRVIVEQVGIIDEWAGGMIRAGR